MKEKNQISLIKDINRTVICKKDGEKVKKEYVMDERVMAEKNKVMSNGYIALIVVLLIYSTIAEANAWRVSTTYILAIIGMVSYSMVLILCNKIAIKENPEISGLFIWSFFTLPIAMLNIIADFIDAKLVPERIGVFITVVPIISMGIIAILMYQVANAIYIKANKGE